MTSAKIREFLDELQGVELPPMEQGRASKAAGLLTRVQHHIEVKEREGKWPPVEPKANQSE